VFFVERIKVFAYRFECETFNLALVDKILSNESDLQKEELFEFETFFGFFEFFCLGVSSPNGT
jgi:hypothetical protein